jgi:hypothetical protein
MEKKKSFFEYLYNLTHIIEPADSNKNTLKNEDIEIIKIDNEWLQEYELIYYSYAIER